MDYKDSSILQASQGGKVSFKFLEVVVQDSMNTPSVHSPTVGVKEVEVVGMQCEAAFMWVGKERGLVGRMLD